MEGADGARSTNQVNEREAQNYRPHVRPERITAPWNGEEGANAQWYR